MSTIAFFDVDGTLIQSVSGYHTTLELIRRGILKKRRLPVALFYKLISAFHLGDIRHQDILKMYEIAAIDMYGLHVSDVLQIGREVFEKSVRSTVYQEALDAITAHKKNKDRVILISSGPYMIIKIIEEFVGADDSFAIGPVIQNDVLQKEIAKPLAFMEGKITIAEREAKKWSLSLSQCHFYADGYHDAHLLSAVGFPHAVNPDCKLKKVALQKGWPILEFKHLLKNA